MFSTAAFWGIIDQNLTLFSLHFGQSLAHLHPRPKLTSFFKQYYLYARGDGKADLWRVRHVIRYSTYLIAAPAIFLLGLCHTPLWWLLFLIGGAIMFWTPYRRLWPMIQSYSFADRIKAILWVPIIRVTGDIAKVIGYPVGVFWWLRQGRVNLTKMINCAIFRA